MLHDVSLFERDVCIRAKGGTREGIGEAMIFNLLGFITTVSLMANIHCMTDGLTLAYLVP